MKIRLLTLLAMLVVGGILVTACGGGAAPTPTPRGDAVAGKNKFESTCSACHGPDAKGIVGLGKDLTTSEFSKVKTDEELVAFLNKGRDPSDPLSTTGVAMPPKGGNPALDDDDLFDIVRYVRTLER